MRYAEIRPDTRYVWVGTGLLVVDTSGQCGPDVPLCGYYQREARHLSLLALRINGNRPWCCGLAGLDHRSLEATYIYPELAREADPAIPEEERTDARGTHDRALDVRLRLTVHPDHLEARGEITNHRTDGEELELELLLDADFADIEEANFGHRRQRAPVERQADHGSLRIAYRHPDLPLATHLTVQGDGDWTSSAGGFRARVSLGLQQTIRFVVIVHPEDPAHPMNAVDAEARERALLGWRARLTRVEVPGNRDVERILRQASADVSSFPLLDGLPDEWLTPQAGLPLYPALFGRDAVTMGWQAAILDRGEQLDASLARLGRMQADGFDWWRDAAPGRLPYQSRQGPLARLGFTPYAAYYADVAGPFMYVIALAHAYAWSGDRAMLRRHWDTARRVLDWARDHGDRDGDGYIEYETADPEGTRNQGWKDSASAILYPDGRVVPTPLAPCEVQGYWYAAQQLAAVLAVTLGERSDAVAWWRSAAELATRFDRDFWVEEEGFFALALDPDKRAVATVTSNVGHALATGIIARERLDRVVARLFAPDLFSGWGIRTLSDRHPCYHPLSYHRGSVWTVENATIAFGLRRFGYAAEAARLAAASFDLAAVHHRDRIPECVGGYPRDDDRPPGAYPWANAPQGWNATAFPLFLHTLLGLQPVAPLRLLVVDPVLPAWLPEVVLHDLRVGDAKVSLAFRRDAAGRAHVEVLRREGAVRVVRQPPPESGATVGDRLAALLSRLGDRLREPDRRPLGAAPLDVALPSLPETPPRKPAPVRFGKVMRTAAVVGLLGAAVVGALWRSSAPGSRRGARPARPTSRWSPVRRSR